MVLTVCVLTGTMPRKQRALSNKKGSYKTSAKDPARSADGTIAPKPATVALQSAATDQDRTSQIDRSVEHALDKFQREEKAGRGHAVTIKAKPIEKRAFRAGKRQQKAEFKEHAVAQLQNRSPGPAPGAAGPKEGSLRALAPKFGVNKSTLQRWSAVPSSSGDVAIARGPFQVLDKRGGHNRRVSFPIAVLVFYFVDNRHSNGLYTSLTFIGRAVMLFETVMPQYRTINTSVPGRAVLSRLCTMLGIGELTTQAKKANRWRPTFGAEIVWALYNVNCYDPAAIVVEDEVHVKHRCEPTKSMGIKAVGGIQLIAEERGPASTFLVFAPLLRCSPRCLFVRSLAVLI